MGCKDQGKNYLFSERRPRCRNGKNNMPIVVPTRWSRRGKTDSRYRKFTLLNVEPSEWAMELHAGAIRAKTCCRIVFPKCHVGGTKRRDGVPPPYGSMWFPSDPTLPRRAPTWRGGHNFKMQFMPLCRRNPSWEQEGARKSEQKDTQVFS